MLIAVTIVTNSGQRFCKIDEVYLWWLFSKKLGSHFRGRPILFITRVITDRIGLTIINDRILTTPTRDIQMNIWNIICLNCGERYEDTIAWSSQLCTQLKQLWFFFRLQVWRESQVPISNIMELLGVAIDDLNWISKTTSPKYVEKSVSKTRY